MRLASLHQIGSETEGRGAAPQPVFTLLQAVCAGTKSSTSVEGFHGKPLLEATNPIGVRLVLTVGQSDSGLGGNIAFELLKREKGARS